MTREEKSVQIQSARSFLFTPGDQPDRIVKALSLDCDAVIIDLEDAVRSENKESARASLADLLQGRTQASPLVLIRVNSFTSPEFKEDIKVAIALKVDGIVIPKFVAGEEAHQIDQFLSEIEGTFQQKIQTPVIGLVETSAGVLSLIANPDFPSRVKRLALGLADLAADLGATQSSESASANFAKASLLMASASRGLGSPIDSPSFEISDEVNFRKSSLESHQLGFGGRLCIHPKQIEIINEAFQPSSQQRDWAKKVMDKWNNSDDQKGALQIDGSLVDEAMVKRARQILNLI